MCPINTATVALAINIVFFTHLNRSLVTTIFLEIARKILGIVQLLHLNSNSIDGLRILMWTDCQCRTKVVKTKLNRLFSSLVQTKIITYLATVSPLWLISQMLGFLKNS